jgi:methylenetetrahydrofolate--tRNA-(uracil-5-)-methyltransferase
LKATIVGAGLAGCEAAYQLTRFNIPVTLIDMKPGSMSPAHHSTDFAELVCSNSLKADRIENACGLLKEEMRIIGSLCMAAANYARLPAGGALAVDRNKFSNFIMNSIQNNPLIEIKEQIVDRIPNDDCVIIATGPLTQGALSEDIIKVLETQNLSFYDAASPIVTFESINMDIAFRQSRYDKGSDDYINCPMNDEQYKAFQEALINADVAPIHDFEDRKVFEGCMPIETMAKRGEDTIRFGPLKPVGLMDKRTEIQPFACVQLRQDNESASLYNLVGFQTRLTFKSQETVFRMIPGLENAEFVRYGVMHRNTFIKSPGILNNLYQCIKIPNLFFAGQITGVEGYVESMASGMSAGINAALYLFGKGDKFELPSTTVTGALSNYISDTSIKHFQPMNSNFGIVDSLPVKVRKKEDRYNMVAQISIDILKKEAEKLKSIMSF